MLKAFAWGVCILLVLILLATIRARHRFAASIDKDWRRLQRQPVTPHAATGRPEVISKFAARAIRGVPDPPPAIILEQEAAFRMTPEEPFREMTARQIIRVSEPGFVWVARTRMLPGVEATIVDGYLEGSGRLEVRLLGALRIARGEGDQLARGELMRYLAEIPWAPHALLYNPSLSFRQIEPSLVEVSAPSRGGIARVRLAFDPQGDLCSIEADDRPRTIGGRLVEQRWRGEFWEYKRVRGIRIPTLARVAWEPEGGRFVYWEGRILDWDTVKPLEH